MGTAWEEVKVLLPCLVGNGRDEVYRPTAVSDHEFMFGNRTGREEGGVEEDREVKRDSEKSIS